MAEITPLASPGATELLRLLRDGRGRSRGRLAELAGIARSTAGVRVDELLAADLVVEGEASYTGGRPSTKVRLQPRARVVLAADVGATHARVAVADLVGEVIAERIRKCAPSDEPEAILTWVVQAASVLLSELRLDVSKLAAAAIGLAAPIDFGSGTPVDPPIMPRWRDFDVRAWLAPALAVPVLVEKDVNLMALGEHLVSPGTRRNMLFVKIATGIGVGVVNNGVVQRGEQGLAGDIGHVRVAADRETPCHCGNVGCLEALASGPAMAARLAARGKSARTGQDVVDLVREGDLDAIQLVRQAGRDLGEVLAMCVSLLNPSTIILGGTIASAGEHLLAGVREAVYARSMPRATKQLTIAHTEMGQLAAIRGAAAVAIDRLMAADVGRR